MINPKPMSQEVMVAAVTELDQAIYTHEQWAEEINAGLICRLRPDGRDTADDSYRQCRFGQWYYGAGVERLVGYPGFAEVEMEHKRMHQYAGSLLQAAANGAPISLQDYERYAAAMKRTRLEILTLKREIEVSLYNIDALTGVPGRLEMLRKLRDQREFVRRNVHRCAIAMLDIDHFKAVNDSQGHLAGDHVLVDIAGYIQTHLRPYDLLFRYGGEEFLLCLPDTDLETAREICDRLREELGGLSHTVNGGPPVQVTVSLGIAELNGDFSVEEALDRADRALFAAKAAGRDRVLAWARSMSEGEAMPHPPPGQA